jgi:hypothetical protein
VSRDEWSLEHVTAPRPSCIDKWKWRNELRLMYPGDTRYVNGVQVYKCQHNHAKTRYVVAGGKMVLFDDAVALIEAKQPTGRAVQMALPLDIQEAS